MFSLFGIGFASPWLLLGLLALPVLWILLRAVPPAPLRRLFPAVTLLLGLRDDEAQTDRTPWWLLLIRTLAIAAAIIGFAGPVLNPDAGEPSEGPLLIVADASWASARDWPARIDRMRAALEEAGRQGRAAALAVLSDPEPGPPVFQSADSVAAGLAGLAPRPWQPDVAAVAAWSAQLAGEFDTLWFSDGLAREGRDELMSVLGRHGTVRVFEGARPVLALGGATYDEGIVRVPVRRAATSGGLSVRITANGADPNGIERVLATADADFAPGEGATTVEFSLPPELRNRVNRFEIEGLRSAGAVSLTDDALKRREVGLVAASDDREALELLSPSHYLRRALQPTADVIEGAYEDILLANPDVLILVDIATLSPDEAEKTEAWVRDGGLLLRFAGPRLAASELSRETEDTLMPVRLRAGGRRVGGTMSWGEPKSLRAFSETSPFFGLAVPDDVRVSAQVMAQPDPGLPEKVIASLSDGTPLVTRKRLGAGQVVLFHVTANAEWSSLPLSGLFVQMLERLAVSTRPARPDVADLAGTIWIPAAVLDGFGDLEDASGLAGVPGERLAEARVGPNLPPGLYADDDQRIAINVLGPDDSLAATSWPAGTDVEGFAFDREITLKGPVLTAALILLLADLVASIWLSGGLLARRAATAATALLVLAVLRPEMAQAQEDTDFARQATAGVVLAYVETGDPRIDEITRAGLRGLSIVLTQRTSVEPAPPMAVNVEEDELSFFPMLFWPVTAEAPLPSAAANARLNAYLRSGGMIVFDTRDADIARYGADSPAGRRLQRIASALDIPPLEPVPGDHVLTRTFYLLQDFPGRFNSRDVWVEAAPPGAELIEGMPFRNLNDNVTPVVIGGNDWAAAWAVDDNGNWMVPIGRGQTGARQRELAFRFGINLVMHVLTGNYKSDQVHVPALLERLGQ